MPVPETFAPHAPGPAGYRRWQRCLAFAVLLLPAVVLALGLAAPRLAGWYVERVLRAAGFAEARVDWRRLDAFGGEVRLYLDAGQRIERLSLDYGPGQWLHGSLGRLRVEGLRLRIVATADGRHTLAGLRPAAGASPAAVPVLPFKSVELNDARIDLPLPDGRRLDLPFSATLTRGADGRQTLDGTIGALAPGFGARFGGTLGADGSLQGAVSFGIDDAGRFLAGLDLAPDIAIDGRLRGVVRIGRASGAPLLAEIDIDGDGLRAGDWLTDGRLGVGVRLQPAGGADGSGGHVLYALRPLTLGFTPGPALAARLPPDLATAPLRLGLHTPDDEPLLALLPAEPARLAGELGLSLGDTGLGGALTVTRTADRLRWTLRAGLLGLQRFALAGSGLTLDGELVGGATPALHTQLLLPRLESLAQPALHAPLALEGDVEGDPAGALSWSLALRLVDGAGLGRCTGRHDFSDGRGELKLGELQVTLGDAAPAIPLAALSPALAAQIAAPRGRLALRAGLHWAPGSPLQSQAQLRIDDLDLAAGGVRAQRIDGVLRATSLWPLQVGAGQPLAIARLDAGLPLTDGLVEPAIDGTRVVLRHGGFALAGGRLELEEPLVFDGAPSRPLAVVARDIDLGQLLAILPVDGLEGSGTLAGRIDARLAHGEVRDLQARLASVGPGLLRYAPSTPPTELTDGQAGFVLEVLRDFRYETLTLTLTGERPQALSVGLNVRGTNPQVYDGHPVALNLNLSGGLATLLQQGLDSYRLPDTVRKRLEQYDRESR